MDQAPASAVHATASSLDRDVASFARHLRAANLSPKTIKTYLEAATQFQRFLVGRRPATMETTRREHVAPFIADLLERHRPATAHNRWTLASRPPSGRSVV